MKACKPWNYLIYIVLLLARLLLYATHVLMDFLAQELNNLTVSHMHLCIQAMVITQLVDSVFISNNPYHVLLLSYCEVIGDSFVRLAEPRSLLHL